MYAESLYPQRFGWAALRSLRGDKYKVVDAPRPELYDLASDPREARNVFDEHREVGAAMLHRLSAHDDRRNQPTDANQGVERDVAARLSSLGYVGDTAGQLPTAARGQIDPKDQVDAFNRLTRIHLENVVRREGWHSGCRQTPR